MPTGAGESSPDVRQGALGGRRARLDGVNSCFGSGEPSFASLSKWGGPDQGRASFLPSWYTLHRRDTSLDQLPWTSGNAMAEDRKAGFTLQLDDSVRLEMHWPLISKLPDLYIDHWTILEQVHDLRQVCGWLHSAIRSIDAPHGTAERRASGARVLAEGRRPHRRRPQPFAQNVRLV